MVASSIFQGSSFPTLEQKFALRNILHTFPFQDVTRIENRENQQETKKPHFTSGRYDAVAKWTCPLYEEDISFCLGCLTTFHPFSYFLKYIQVYLKYISLWKTLPVPFTIYMFAETSVEDLTEVKASHQATMIYSSIHCSVKVNEIQKILQGVVAKKLLPFLLQ